MDRVRKAPRRGAWHVLFVCAVFAALALPTAASAATATYASLAPAPNSRSLVSTPTITVTVNAAVGVKGASSYSLSLDGVKVRPSIKYLTTRYRKFGLTYRRTTALAPGLHKVTVTVRDLKKHSSSRTWTFTVLAPPKPIVDMQVTIEPNACATCHPDYPARHPMTACALCHGLTAPVPGVAYGPTSNSAHTPACAASPCHQPNPGTFPHVLWSDCSRCHAGTYIGIPRTHGAATSADHMSTSTQCTTAGCHDASLTVEHMRYSVNGAPFSCETCHTNSDPMVVAALAARSTACTSCHAELSVHAGAAAAHALPASGCLTGQGCHIAADVSALHKGACADCHAVGRTPSRVCSTCHAAEPHPNLDARHAAAPIGCTVSGCHLTDVRAIHSAGSNAPGCAACHGTGKPPLTLVCATVGCHPSTSSAHGAHVVPPVSAPISIGGTSYGSHACSECHPLDLIPAHGARCSTCHGTGTAATLAAGCTQAACHSAGTARAPHAGIDAAHTLTTATTCVMTDCHSGGTNVAALHASHGGCAACHRAGIAPTLTCGTTGCHSATDAHPVTRPHPKMLTLHSTGLPGTCVKPGCHLAELAVLHSAAKGCSTCHGAGRTPTGNCTAAGCHASDVTAPALHPAYATGHVAAATGCTKPGCHDTNAITVHTTGPTKPGCPACHAAGKPALTLACETVGCHAGVQADHDSHPVAPAAQAVTILGASFGTHACSECHTPLDLQDLHGQSCSACHTGVVLTATISGGCAQAGCHASGALKQHGSIDAAHALAAVPSCIGVECHTGGTNVALIHASRLGGGVPRGCAACHGPGITPTLDCAKAGCHPDNTAAHGSHPVTPAPAPVTILGTSFGTHACSECHAPLDLQDLHGRACSSCHTGTTVTATLTGGCAQIGCHASGTLKQHGSIDAAHALATAPCTGSGCHAATTNLAALHAGQGCAICHGAGKTAIASCATPGCHGPSDSHPYAAPHPSMSASHGSGLSASCVKSGCHSGDLASLHAAAGACATCHWGSKPASATCVQSGCHTADVSAMHGSHPATVAPASIRINGLSLGTFACITCHASMDLQVIHAGAGGCAACHPGAAGAVGTWDGGCQQAACHGATSAHPMHANVNAAHTLPTQPGCTATAGCHQGNSNVGGRDFALMHFPTAKGCGNCHTPGQTRAADCAACHAQWATGDHQADHKSCNDCHAPYVWDPVTSTANKGANLVAGVHWPLFDAQWTLSIGRALIRAGYPKGDYTMLQFPPATLGAPGAITTTYFDRTVSYTCTACHTGAGRAWVHPGSSYFGCGSGGDCHQHHANWDPAQGSETYVHLTPPASWVATMTW